jgi:hypothetical protein
MLQDDTRRGQRKPEAEDSRHLLERSSARALTYNPHIRRHRNDDSRLAGGFRPGGPDFSDIPLSPTGNLDYYRVFDSTGRESPAVLRSAS